MNEAQERLQLWGITQKERQELGRSEHRVKSTPRHDTTQRQRNMRRGLSPEARLVLSALSDPVDTPTVEPDSMEQRTVAGYDLVEECKRRNQYFEMRRRELEIMRSWKSQDRSQSTHVPQDQQAPQGYDRGKPTTTTSSPASVAQMMPTEKQRQEHMERFRKQRDATIDMYLKWR